VQQDALPNAQSSPGLGVVRGEPCQHDNAPNPVWLLPPRSERQCRRGAENRDEFASSHGHPTPGTGPIAVRFLRIVVLAVAAPLYLDAHPTSAASESPPSVLSIAVDGLSQGCKRGTLAQD